MCYTVKNESTPNVNITRVIINWIRFSKFKVSISPSFTYGGTNSGRQRGKTVRSQRGWRTPGQCRLTEPEAVIMKPTWLCTRYSVYVSWLLASCFCDIPNKGGKYITDSLAWSWESFPPIGLSYEVTLWRVCLVSLYLVLSWLALTLMVASSFMKHTEVEQNWKRGEMR